MSLDASGTIGGILTASKWKGIPYMRLRVTPSNPKTAGQNAVRSALGTVAKACAAVLTSFMDIADVGSPFFTTARDNAPSGQSWISWVHQQLDTNLATLHSTYIGLSGTIKGYYDSSAAGANLVPYVDVAGTTHSAGEQLYLLAIFAVANLAYAGFATSPDAASSTETDNFADYVHVTTP
jgi:hypothetical protein